MRIYISGALKGSKDLAAARRLYEATGRMISSAGHEPYIPHLTTDPDEASVLSPQIVYKTDLKELLIADGVIAFLNEPSHGVGAEISICSEHKMPMLAVCHHDTEVSRFAQGCLEVAGGRLERYSTQDQLVRIVTRFLADLECPTKFGLPARQWQTSGLRNL